MAATRNLKARAIAWVAGMRERHRWLDVAARGYGRYQRTEGSVSAVHVAYSAFFSIFPLLFAAVGIFGLVLRNNPGLRDRLLAQAAANLPGALHEPVEQSIRSAQTSARTALGVGLLLLLYSGTGMVVALERGLSRAFGLERAGSFVKQRTRAVGWLLSIGLLLGVSVVAAGVLGGASGAILEALGVTGGPARASSFLVTLLVSFAIDVALFTLTFVLLPNRALRARQVLPGALICAVWWGLLKSFGAFFVARTIHNTGEVFGQLAIVVGLLVFIDLAAQLLMLTASIQAELLLGPVEAAAPTVGLVEAARGHPPPPAGGAPGARRRVGRLAAAGAALAFLTLRRRRAPASPAGPGVWRSPRTRRRRDR
jgi:membrane protein